MWSIEVMSGMVAFQLHCINPYLGQPTRTGTPLHRVTGRLPLSGPVPPLAVQTSTRIGVRLASEKLAWLRQQLHEIGLQYADADDPDGVAVSLFIGLHRRDSVASSGDPPDKE